MKSVDLEFDGKRANGIEVPLPKAPLVVAFGKNGFVMCGYLSIDAADKLGAAAAVVKGVTDVNELLAGKVVSVSKAGAAKGAKVGMTGRQALARFV